jgi:hypothetical protein
MSYIALATTTLGASTASVTFSSIPTSVGGVALRDLVIIANGNVSNGFENCIIRLNGSSSGYSNVLMSGGSGGVTSRTDDTTNFRFSFYSGWNNVSRGTIIAQIFDYSQNNKHKTALGRSNTPSGGVFQGSDAGAGRWASNDVVTSLQCLSGSGITFLAGTTFSLYGIAG